MPKKKEPMIFAAGVAMSPAARRHSKREKDHWSLLLFLVVVVVTSTGCIPEVSTPTNIPTVVLGLVLDRVRRAKGLRFDKGDSTDPDKISPEREADGHRGFFVYRRAIFRQATQATVGDVADRIGEEFEEVLSFENDMIKGASGKQGLNKPAPDGPSTAAFSAAFTCDSGKHLDLDNVAVWKTNGTADKDKTSEYQTRRVKTAIAIIWRAAGIHSDLWDITQPDKKRLNRDALEELLDRRLRMVERMHNEVNAGMNDAQNEARFIRRGPPPPTIRNWVDGIRARMFEYPRFSARNVASLLDTNKEAWSPPNANVNTRRITFRWFVPTTNHPNRKIIVRMKTELNPDQAPSTIWRVPDQNYGYYRRFFQDATTNLTKAVDDLMTPDLNMWQRSWFLCDHVIASLHLDGLHFALKRRAARQKTPPAKDGDTTFGDLGTTNGYVVIPATFSGVPVGDLSKPEQWRSKELGTILNEGSGPWFQNLYLHVSDLQVGDHVIFYNHIMYVVLWVDDFRLENAVVDAIQSDPKNGSLKLAAVKLSGHGMAANNVLSYAAGMASSVKSGLLKMQEESFTFANKAQSDKAFLTPSGFLCFQWSPYPGFPAGEIAPWFFWLPRAFETTEHPPYAIVWPDVNTMMGAITHSLIGDPNPGPDYTPMPASFFLTGTTADSGVTKLYTFDLTQEGVMFPLYEPKLKSGKVVRWMDYFALRANPATHNQALNPGLELVGMSANAPDPQSPTGFAGDIPGFFLAGRKAFPVPVLRPTVRPTY